jgi:hypothetical protein
MREAEAALGVGADIEAYCGKCGTVWHVVVAMVGGRIAQVECKECGRRHRVRGGGATGTTGAKPETARPHRRTGQTATRAAKGGKSMIEPDLSRPPVRYSASARFAPGQRVEHTTFGPGIVERVLGPGKVQIHFAGGSRVLAMGRAG